MYTMNTPEPSEERVMRMKNIARTIHKDTIHTQLLCHEEPTSVMAATVALARTGKNMENKIKQVLDGIKQTYETDKLYQTTPKGIKVLYLPLVAARRKHVTETAVAVIKQDTNEVYGMLDLLLTSGLDTFVTKVLDKATLWCKRSGGYSRKLYKQSTNGDVQLERKSDFDKLKSGNNYQGCEPKIRSKLFETSKKEAIEASKTLQSIGAQGKRTVVQTPPRAPLSSSLLFSSITSSSRGKKFPVPNKHKTVNLRFYHTTNEFASRAAAEKKRLRTTKKTMGNKTKVALKALSKRSPSKNKGSSKNKTAWANMSNNNMNNKKTSNALGYTNYGSNENVFRNRI